MYLFNITLIQLYLYHTLFNVIVMFFISIHFIFFFCILRKILSQDIQNEATSLSVLLGHITLLTFKLFSLICVYFLLVF